MNQMLITCLTDMLLKKQLVLEYEHGTRIGMFVQEVYPHHPVFDILGPRGINTARQVSDLPELEKAMKVAREIKANYENKSN